MDNVKWIMYNGERSQRLTDNDRAARAVTDKLNRNRGGIFDFRHDKETTDMRN